MYPLKKGKVATQAHVGLPEGTYEEEHGRKGFYGKSAHLYHAHPPTGWIRFEGKLRPHCFDLNNLEPTTVMTRAGYRSHFLGNSDVKLYVSRRSERDAVLLPECGRRRIDVRPSRRGHASRRISARCPSKRAITSTCRAP